MDPDPSLFFTEIAIIIVCLIFSAAFSASETAITSFNELKAKHLIEKLGRQAKVMEFWLRQPTRVLTTILVGNNLVNILGSAVATDLVTRIFPSGGILIATAVMTVTILLFSEVLPKIFAKVYSESMVLISLRFVRVFSIVLMPAVAFFSKVAETLLSLFRKNGESLKPMITEEELTFLINMSEAEGALEQEKRKFLSNIFEFGNTIVREIMTPRTDMVCVSAQSTGAAAVQAMLDKGHSRLPVFEERIDNIIGIIHAKDLLRRVKEKSTLEFPVREIVRDPIFVSETKSVDELLIEMRSKKRQMAIVVDEHGGTAGLVTFEDLIEEIVGEVRDEYDEQEEDFVQKVSPNRYLIDARLNFEDFLHDFKDHIHAAGEENEAETGNGKDREPDEEAEEAEYDTVGGLMIDRLGHIPRVGEEIQLGQLRLTVREAGRRRVKKVEVVIEHPHESETPVSSEAK